MSDPLKDTLESHSTCTREINKAVDDCVKRLINDCGYAPRAVIMSCILTSMRGVGRMLSGVPDDLRQMVRDRAFSEFYIGASEPTDEMVSSVITQHLKEMIKQQKRGER